MFITYVATKGGKITLRAMPSRRREVEKTAADMSIGSDFERVSVAAYGRIIAAFKNGARIDAIGQAWDGSWDFVGAVQPSSSISLCP